MGEAPPRPRLTKNQVKFLSLVFRGVNKTEAMLTIKPGINRDSATTLGARWWGRLTKQIGGNWERWQEVANLGDDRLALELNRMLRAKKTEFYQGKAVANCIDNGTRMRALELLADFRGHRKTNVNISGELTVAAAEMSPAERKQWLDQNLERLAKILQARGWKPPDAERPA